MIQNAAFGATAETIVKVDPQTISVNVGETSTVNIIIIEVQNLYGIEVELFWNSSILKPVNVDVRLGQTDGVLYNPIYIVENSTLEGKYVLAATSYSPAPSFNGSGNIVRITFNVTNLGDSKLDLETQLWDRPPPNDVSSPIYHTTIDGFVNAIPEIPSITILTILIIIATLVVLLSKKILKKTSSHLQYQPQQSKLTFISTGKVTEGAG